MQVDYSEALTHIRLRRLQQDKRTRISAPATPKLWPPDYSRVYDWRRSQLAKFAAQPERISAAKRYYRHRPVEFINHWCDTWDPRNAGTAKPVQMPFILFKRQVELVEFLLTCLHDQEGALIEKSRDMGATWIGVSFSIWLWLFHPGSAIGWGSRKQELVDRIGDPSSIFEKLRLQIAHLPQALLPAGFSHDVHLTFQRCVNPESGATIIGEIGDNIGRGARTSMYFKDESSHYEHPEKIEAALSDTTRVPIDISSVNGPGNVFHRKREAGVDWVPGSTLAKGRTRVFVLDWRDHPEKSQDWYKLRREDYERRGLLHLFAQEIDRNYVAALENVIIQDQWVKAAVDAHVKLGAKGLVGFDDGAWVAALDVADTGGDTNALAQRKGVVLRRLQEWGERDPGLTARRAVAACRDLGPVTLQYDSIGVGAGVKAETNRLADESLLPVGVVLVPWMAGAPVLGPADHVIAGDVDSPRNKDFYANLKAQAWWQLGQRFFRTWQAVEQGVTHDPDDLISLDSTLPLLHKLEKELCQATATRNSRMKLLVDKNPEGAKSPNLADAVVMCFHPITRPLAIPDLGLVGGKLFRSDDPEPLRTPVKNDDYYIGPKILR